MKSQRIERNYRELNVAKTSLMTRKIANLENANAFGV